MFLQTIDDPSVKAAFASGSPIIDSIPSISGLLRFALHYSPLCCTYVPLSIADNCITVYHYITSVSKAGLTIWRWSLRSVSNIKPGSQYYAGSSLRNVSYARIELWHQRLHYVCFRTSVLEVRAMVVVVLHDYSSILTCTLTPVQCPFLISTISIVIEPSFPHTHTHTHTLQGLWGKQHSTFHSCQY